MFGVQTSSRKVARVAAARGSDPDDPQKEAVYAFEDSWQSFNNSDLTLAQCRDAVRWACEAWKVPTPVVRQHHEATFSWCNVETGVISLQARSRRPGRGGKNAAVALHEAAHWIVFQRWGERVQDHGPTFVGVYIGLLWQYGVAPIEALMATARKFKLRFP